MFLFFCTCGHKFWRKTIARSKPIRSHVCPRYRRTLKVDKDYRKVLRGLTYLHDISEPIKHEVRLATMLEQMIEAAASRVGEAATEVKG